MPHREELPARLRSALDELAGADLEQLLVEARAEARAAVKARLREAYEEALLRRADRDLEPAPERREPRAPERETGAALWLYCVVPAGHELPRGLIGVDSGAPRLVTCGGLAGVVSEVPLDEFGEEPLRENLNDLAWLERTVRAHEGVLEALLPEGPLVPMRVCTIYRGEEQVRAALETQAPVLADSLEELRERTEWGVKVVADRARIEAAARERSPEARGLAEQLESGGGGAYIARKKLDSIVRDDADALLNDVVRETHARLEEWAVASVVLPAQSRELAGYDGEMVFNGAYLVDDERTEAFRDLLSELAAQYGPQGLAFDLTGPWPAYNFSGSGAEARP